MIAFSPVCIIRHFFLIPLRRRIRQILLYSKFYCTRSLKITVSHSQKFDHCVEFYNKFIRCECIDCHRRLTSNLLPLSQNEARSASKTVVYFSQIVFNSGRSHLWAARFCVNASCWKENTPTFLNMTGTSAPAASDSRQWVSTLKGAIFRPTILLKSRTKEILTQVAWHILFYCRTKSVAQNIRGLFKDCWEPHKWCLGAACGRRNRVWEPLF